MELFGGAGHSEEIVKKLSNKGLLIGIDKDEEALEAFKILSRLEGIIPAIESSHAVSYALKYAKNKNKEDYIIVNLSGRGDKDVQELMSKIK